MKLRTVQVSTLIEDPKNARIHPERNIEVIKNSLRRFGQRIPLVVRDDVVVVGNGRLVAMRDLGWSEVVVVDANDMSDEEAGAFALVDNRSSELADWNGEALQDLLTMADDDVLSSIDLGFTDEEFRQMTSLNVDIGEFAKPLEAEAGRDDADSVVAPNANWFYIEYYDDDETFNRLREVFLDGGVLKSNSKHELDSSAFAEIVKAWSGVGDS